MTLTNSRGRLFNVVSLTLSVFQNNVMVFIAELFWWFESVKPGFVQPRGLQEIRDGEVFTLRVISIDLDLDYTDLFVKQKFPCAFIARLLLKPKGAQSQVSSSNVTKSAFMSSSNSADVLTEPTGPDLRYCSHELNVFFFSLLFMSNVTFVHITFLKKCFS